jgi:hypothetical protein
MKLPSMLLAVSSGSTEFMLEDNDGDDAMC